MADVKKNVLVNHSAEKMFNLVDRIEDYPLFLPWCGGSQIIERNDKVTTASIHIKYSGVNQSFTTQILRPIIIALTLSSLMVRLKCLKVFGYLHPFMKTLVVSSSICIMSFQILF
jgi:ribosome-associated toxin RatA of RatAB toxin-antitoxin module